MARFVKALHRCRMYYDTHEKRLFFVGIFIIVVLAGAAILPKDKAPDTDSREAAEQVVKTHVVRSEAAEDESENPLKQDAYPLVNQVVEEYYRGLAKDAKFVDSYDSVRVYTKLGPYKNSYVAFAQYEMKIKDIYTKVPGLGTLYIEEGKDGKLSVIRHVKDENVSSLVSVLMQHADVKNLTASVEQGYTDAVASDALLREALEDLKEAYENTAGTGRVAVKEIKPE